MRKEKIQKLNTAQSAAKRFGLGMTTPTVIVLLIMTAYPLLFTIYYSFTNFNLLKHFLRVCVNAHTAEFIHLKLRAVFSDSRLGINRRSSV